MDITHDFVSSNYNLWARSFHRSDSSLRRWQLSIDSTVSDLFGDLSGSTFLWEQNSQQYVLSGSELLELSDASPDAYWTYPDLVILTDDSNFDPSTNCGEDASQLVLEYPRMYTMSTCGIASTNIISQFDYTVTTGSITWACATLLTAITRP